MGNSSSSINKQVNTLINSEQNAQTETETQTQSPSQLQPQTVVCDQTCQNNKLNEKADKIVSILKNNFNNSSSEALQMLDSYNSLYLNLNNVVELVNKYLKENDILEKDIKNVSSDILTNDRKTYYEEQSINRLKKFYNWMKYLYIFIIIVFLFCIFLVPNNMSFNNKIFIFILLCLYPFVIHPIFRLLNWIYEKIMNIMPKNVYKTL